MPVITCMICGSTSAQSLDINICTKCIRIGNDSTKILAIKKYLEKYPKSTIDDIINFLHISREDVNRFIEQGSLKLVQDGIEFCISQDTNNNDKDKRREQFIKQISDFSSNSSNVNRIFRNNNAESRLVKDLERKKNNYRGQEK